MKEIDGGSLFSLFFVCLLLLSGCAKNQVPTAKTTINLVSQETKTMIQYDSASGNYKPSWTAGDKLGVYIHSGGGYIAGVKNSATSALSANCEVANFTLEVQEHIDPGKYNLYAYYPYSTLDGEYDNARVNIPSEQRPANNSLDPSADVLSAKPIQIDVDQSQTISVSLQFARKTAIVRFVPTYSGTNDYVDNITI